MADKPKDTVGRPPALTAGDIRQELREADVPLTITMLSERFDGVTRRTVQKRVKELASTGELDTTQYGNATAYRLTEHTETSTPAGSASIAILIGITTILAAVVGFVVVGVDSPTPTGPTVLTGALAAVFGIALGIIACHLLLKRDL